MIEFALATQLLTSPTISAIVGNRVYEGRAPQTAQQRKTDARIVYRLIERTERYYHTTGASGLVEAEIELMLTAESYVKARELYEAVRNKIDGFQGLFGSVEIDRCVLSVPSRATGDPTQGDDTGYPTVKATATIHYQETIPTFT